MVFWHIQCLHFMNSQIAWVLVPSRTQVQRQIKLDPDYLSGFFGYCENRKFSFPTSKTLLNASLFDFLKFQTRRRQKGGYSTLRSSLQNLIWWWQFLLPNIMLLHIRLICKNQIWVTSEINCLKPRVFSRELIRVSLGVSNVTCALWFGTEVP